MTDAEIAEGLSLCKQKSINFLENQEKHIVQIDIFTGNAYHVSTYRFTTALAATVSYNGHSEITTAVECWAELRNGVW